MIIKSEKLVPMFEDFALKTFVGVKIKTLPEFLAKGRHSKIPFFEKFGIDRKDIVKINEFTAGLGYNYASLMEKRLEKKGEVYDAGKTWHKSYNGSSVIREKISGGNDLYFAYMMITDNPCHIHYENDLTGEVITLDGDALKEYKPIEKDEPVVRYQVTKISNVQRISACGEVYEISDKIV